MNRYIFSLIAVIAICSVAAGNAASEEVIKLRLGTMAPEKSDWGKALKQMNSNVQEEEIQSFETERESLEKAIKDARLRLDSLRLVVKA